MNVQVNVDASKVLSQQQYAIVQGLADKKSVPEIAQALGVSENTVNTHLRQIRKRLGVSSCADLRGRIVS